MCVYDINIYIHICACSHKIKCVIRGPGKCFDPESVYTSPAFFIQLVE